MSRQVNKFDQQNPFAGHSEAKTISELLGQLAGAASVAWSEPPLGIFESTWAQHLVDQAEIQLAKIQEREYDSRPMVVIYALDYANQVAKDSDWLESEKQEIVDSLVALGVPRLKAQEWVNG